jgi:hypothetical protein
MLQRENFYFSKNIAPYLKTKFKDPLLITEMCFLNYAILVYIKYIDLRTDDPNKKMDAWINIYFLTYFHRKLYK